ncbi:MAG: DUF4184 family protein [Candidatus Hodarchaeota archaeon]
MPFTVFHYPIAFGLSKANKRLSLPGLIVGSVLPDIEVPIMWLFFSNLPDHLVLHSLVGALTLGTVLAVLVTHYIYPMVISSLFSVEPGYLSEKCQISPLLVVSCMLGLLSHLLLDYLVHPFNPLLYPWVDPHKLVGPLVQLFMFSENLSIGYFISMVLTSVIMLILCGIILFKYKGPDLWNHLWVGHFTQVE